MTHVISFVGSSGSGKTTLIEHMTPLLRHRGFRVSAVKHSHHTVEFDFQGKDTWRFNKAGAFEVVLVSDSGMNLQRNFEQNYQMSIHQVIAHMYEGVDWILVEGFKSSDLLKIEVISSPDVSSAPLFASDDFIVAIACNTSFDHTLSTNLPLLPLDKPQAIVDWLLTHSERFAYPPLPI